VFKRLIATQKEASAGAWDDAFTRKTDGYIASWVWKERYKTPPNIGLEASRKNRNFTSQQDQVSHPLIDEQIAGTNDIHLFLSTLEENMVVGAVGGSSCSKARIHISSGDTLNMERQILQMESLLDDESYCANLKDWVVSSDTFASSVSTGKIIDHFYGSNSKTSNNPTLGKILVKDACKCWRKLPRPHTLMLRSLSVMTKKEWIFVGH